MLLRRSLVYLFPYKLTSLRSLRLIAAACQTTLGTVLGFCFVWFSRRFSVPTRFIVGRFALSWMLSGILAGTLISLSGCSSIQQSVGDLFSPGASPWGMAPFENPFQGAEKRRVAAEALYHEVWQIVLQEYVDPSFNGQDWYSWENRFDGRLQDKEDARIAIETMLASLNDEYTRYLPPRDMREQNMQIDSRLSGVGIQISKHKQDLVVIAPLEGSPAAKAGVLQNDVITHIDGVSTAGLTVEQAADKIRGKIGTTVKLSILRKNKPLAISIVRQEITIRSVFGKSLPQAKNIAYIQLNSFLSETAIDEMRQAILKVSGKDALILDLRGNYGGLLSNAVEIADMFLDNGKIVSIVDRNHAKRSYQAEKGQIFRKPLVLLIDHGSASASEILSGALKDNHRAVLVGATTFGKGKVQKINPLADGSGVNITISKYLTPNGTDIDHHGIRPDVPVKVTFSDLEKFHDAQLESAIRLLKSQHTQGAGNTVASSTSGKPSDG